MNDADLVSVRNAGAELLNPPQLLPRRHGRLTPDDLREGFALDVLHDDVRLRREFAVVVRGNNVRVIEGCRGTSFAGETLSGVRQVKIAEENLDRDHSTEDRVVRGVHGPHPTASQSALNVVTSDLGTWLQHSAALLARALRLSLCAPGDPPAGEYYTAKVADLPTVVVISPKERREPPVRG